MPFNGSGVFTTVNTFVPGTTIESSAVNQNFSDIATNGLSLVLTRAGEAGMTAPLPLANGSVSAPALTFTSDTNTGLYRVGADQLGLTAGGVLQATVSTAGVTMASGKQLIGTGGTNSAPDFTFAGDLDNGLYLAAANTPAITAGGTKVLEATASGVNIIGVLTNNSGAVAITTPGGRLTLTSATPVLVSDVTAATTVYYTPYTNGYISIYNGTGWVLSPFSEVSQTLADTTKSPGATTANNNYDMFAWLDSGTFRCTRGPAWSSATSRGTGAGTTEITRVNNGIYVNTNDVTNGPAAGLGVYVGTIRTNNSNQVPMTFSPTAASGGTANELYLWNMYNRVDYTAMVRDSTTSWLLATTLRSWNNSTSNRATFIRGLNEDSVSAILTGRCLVANNGSINFGIGLDSTTAFSSLCRPWGTLAGSSTFWFSTPSTFNGALGLGQHYLQMLELGPVDATNYGLTSTAGQVFQSGLDVRFRA